MPQKLAGAAGCQAFTKTDMTMQTPPFIHAAREHLREREIAKVLQALLAGLENDPRFEGAERTLRVLESNFASVRQQEQRGILSFDEAQRAYNKVVDGILSVMDDVEAGRVSPPAAPPPVQQKRWVWLALGGAVLGILVAAAFFFNRNKPDCPAFEADKKVKILVLPFQNVGTGQAKPALILQNRIRELTLKNNLSATVGILRNYDADKENPSPADATRLCAKCRAELVIWGQYSVGADSSRVAIQYKFLSDGREGGTEVLAFKDITALQGGRMVKGLDDAIFSLCGMIAMREQRWDLAEKWLEKVREPDAADAAMRDWLAKRK